jgi:putative membrane protein
MLVGFLVTWLITALSLYIISRLRLGLEIQDAGTALIAALVLGLLNAVVRPILGFLSLPITIITLGLFALVLNALMLMLMAAIVKGVRVQGFIGALVSSVLLSILTWLISAVVR